MLDMKYQRGNVWVVRPMVDSAGNILEGIKGSHFVTSSKGIRHDDQ